MAIPLHKRPVCVLTSLLVPWFHLVSPDWLTIFGVGPSWAILWLLPWALLDGPVSGFIAGFTIGLMLDGLSHSNISYAPLLMILGWWWGRLGRSGPPIERSFTLGLLAWIGSVVLGLSIWLQISLFHSQFSNSIVLDWGLTTIVSESLLTGLLAPLISSWLFLKWQTNKSY